MNFINLEIGYIVIGLFFLVITAIVTTRSFMPKGLFKKGMVAVFTLISLFIIFHYQITVKRIEDIKTAFEKGRVILCENRESLKGSHVIVITKKAGWSLKDGLFYNPDYYRKFHSARCTVELSK